MPCIVSWPTRVVPCIVSCYYRVVAKRLQVADCILVRLAFFLAALQCVRVQHIIVVHSGKSCDATVSVSAPGLSVALLPRQTVPSRTHQLWSASVSLCILCTGCYYCLALLLEETVLKRTHTHTHTSRPMFLHAHKHPYPTSHKNTEASRCHDVFER